MPYDFSNHPNGREPDEMEIIFYNTYGRWPNSADLAWLEDEIAKAVRDEISKFDAKKEGQQ